MKAKTTYASLLAFAAAAVLLVSACGGGGSGDNAGSAASGGSAHTISVMSVDGVGDVLVDSDGAALYAADQEAGGMVVCTEACAAIWDPLTVADGDTPTAADGVSGELDVMKRPEGPRQVTFNGRLLYRFVEDPSAGTVTGNGLVDSFDGRTFTWHVATPTGISSSDTNSSSSGDDGYGF